MATAGIRLGACPSFRTKQDRTSPEEQGCYYVSRVEASHFDAGTAYASVDGHKSDDLRPYVYVTRDYGASWESIALNLPEYGNVNTVRQDPRNRNLLYAGTEFEFFVSLDEGGSWHRFMTGLPVVRIDDVLVHARDNDLVLATHGRSVMVMDDITPLQQLSPAVHAPPSLPGTRPSPPPSPSVSYKRTPAIDPAPGSSMVRQVCS